MPEVKLLHFECTISFPAFFSNWEEGNKKWSKYGGGFESVE